MAGVAGVPSDAAAVVLNMTVVNAQAAGFATVYPCGQSRPIASNLNYVAGQTIPNLVIAKPGVGGKVCIYSYAAVDVLADVSGFFPAGSGFTPITNPTRVLDTRAIDPAAPVWGAAGDTAVVQAAGFAGVPSDAVAVVLNVTVVNAQAAGFATVYPCGQSRPEASNLNFAAGQTIPNLVIAKPGVGGKVCVYISAALDLLADVSGFFPAGSGFTPIPNPARILDTRTGTGTPSSSSASYSTCCIDPPNPPRLTVSVPNDTNARQQVVIYTSLLIPYFKSVAPNSIFVIEFYGIYSDYLSSQVLINWGDERGYEWLNGGQHIEQTCNGATVPSPKPPIIGLPADAPLPK